MVCRFCGRDLNAHTPQAPAEERLLLTAHPSLWTTFKEILLIIIVAATSIFLHRYTPLALYGLALIPVIALYIWIVRLRHKYTVTSRRVECRERIIAKNTNEVDIKDVRSVTVHQAVIHRIINIGHMNIGTAGTEGVEISMRGIARPHRVKDLILNQK